MFEGFTRRRLTFSKTNCIYETSDYAVGDNECLEKNRIAKTVGVCTFSLANGEIDLKRTAVKIEPQVHGLSSPTLDQHCPELKFDKSVSIDATSCAYYPAPINTFNIYLVEGDNLYFGLKTDTLHGRSGETRPNEVDRSKPLTRVDQ